MNTMIVRKGTVLIAALCLCSPARADVFNMPSGLKSLETVVVGNPGNVADDTGYGAVAYPFKMGEFEITVAQYGEFLNAKAKSDPYGLYDDNILESAWGFKLLRSGEDGNYTYSADPEYLNRPIVMISFWDACRFANWLHNGQGDGDTETGAYTLNGLMGNDRGTIRRNAGAKWFLPSEDEWYKAAYFDQKRTGEIHYWKYTTRSDSPPSRDYSRLNAANYNTGVLLAPVTTEAGAFTNSKSAYGTFDQGGNVWEWTEEVVRGIYRCLRGGSLLLGSDDLLKSSRDYRLPSQPSRLIGFRIAGAASEASGGQVSAIGSSGKHHATVKPDLWASPRELRGKKLIGTGQYSLQNWPPQVTPRFLVEHPDFTATHPFDGVTVVAPLDSAWCAAQGLGVAALDDLTWSRITVPYSAVQGTITELKRISWGSLTDNFLWYRMLRAHTHQPDRDFAVDLTQDGEWAAVQENAALSARICREANLKGFMLDTEQYSTYVGGGAYPMGKDTPALLRRRGSQWIKAVQAEYPAITIIIFFAWSPDLETAEFLAGMRPFLDGVLAGIEEPAKLVHAYENTFYYGQIPGSRYTRDGFPGDRAEYNRAREWIKKWRILSGSPEKYDKFVKVGMAAWVESDPWELSDSSASGSKNTIWSNVPLALAYSDEYVWVWSEGTHYGRSHLRDVHHIEPNREPVMPSKGFLQGESPNLFLASLSNQTFNTGRERVTSLDEDFTGSPLQRGWYFDFDMLDAGRKADPAHAVPIFSAAAVPYVWSPEDRAVRIQGAWMTGPNGDVASNLGRQRRRFVHPIRPLTERENFHAELDFRVDTFGSDASNPIVLGLFNSGQPINRQSVALQIGTPDDVSIIVVGDGKPLISKITVNGGLKAGITYRVTFDFDGTKRQFRADLKKMESLSVVGQVNGVTFERLGRFELDEMGVAMWDADETNTPKEKAYRYRLERVSLRSTDR
jgi:formylglycine-generating enzyme